MTVTPERLMNPKNLRPTHSCFDDSIRFALTFDAPAERDKMVIVHAACRSTVNPRVFAHSWIQYPDPDLGCQSVVQAMRLDGELFYMAVSDEEFRCQTLIVQEARYSFVDAIIFHAVTGTGGPWEPSILELLNNSGDPESTVYGAVQYGRSAIINEPPQVKHRTTLQLANKDREVMLIASALLMDVERRNKLFDRLREIQKVVFPNPSGKR